MLAVPESGYSRRFQLGRVICLVVCISGGSLEALQNKAVNPPKQSRAKNLAVMPDRIDLPPDQRQFRSTSGGFVLTVKALDGWRTPFSAATLSDAIGSVLWKRNLPHHHGPRNVLVTNGGQVLLADEWINVLSRHALTLIGPDGATIAAYPAEQIIGILGVPRASITDHARFGPWMSDGPKLSADAKSVLFGAGGRSLVLRLQDGRLSARD